MAEIPGRTPMRRLTRAQYNNTVRDLLGVNGDFAGAFSGDEDAGGFRSNVTSPVGEQQLDSYARVAEDLAAKAVGAGLATLAPCVAPKPEATCVDEFVRNFGKRAFRRPLTAEEVTRYKQVFTAGRNGGDFGSGITLVISGLLQSPNFLYLPEVGVAKLAEKDGVPLDPYEVASRLSYFFLSSMPDTELFVAADTDKLRTPEQVAEQARRLFKSPKARDSIVSFYLQWLEITDMGNTEKDAKVFPTFTPALLSAMQAEVASYVDNVTRTGDGRLQTVLSAAFSYPTGPLYDLYGLPAGAANARTDLPAGQRAGLLTLPGVMAVYSHPEQTGPVGRGFLVSEKLLCVTPPPAPDNVDPTLPKPDPNSTTRERMERHRADPTCATCHALMDPYGLTFEIYDAIGRYRTKDGVKAVDATAKALPNIGDVKDAVELMGKLAVSPDVRKCLVTQWFRYGFGREEEMQDNGTLAAALSAFSKTDYSVPELLVGLSTTRGFRYRKPVVLQ